MPLKVFTELLEKRRKKEQSKSKKEYVGNTYKIFSKGGMGQRERAAVLWKCTDAVNSGKNHYVLLMAVIKSKPTIQRRKRTDKLGRDLRLKDG